MWAQHYIRSLRIMEEKTPRGPGCNWRRPSTLPFIAYVITFHLLWACWPYLMYPKIVAIGERTFAYSVVNIGIRLLIWVTPVWLYLRRVDHVQPLDYLRLR